MDTFCTTPHKMCVIHVGFFNNMHVPNIPQVSTVGTLLSYHCSISGRRIRWSVCGNPSHKMSPMAVPHTHTCTGHFGIGFILHYLQLPVVCFQLSVCDTPPHKMHAIDCIAVGHFLISFALVQCKIP